MSSNEKPVVHIRLNNNSNCTPGFVLLLIVLLLIFLTPAFFTQLAVAQESAPADNSVQNASFDSHFSTVEPVGFNSDLTTLEELRELQTKISDMVSANMQSCVAVSDGIGFGSGVVISEQGLVLTAGHVMVGRGDYEVIFPNGRRAKAIPLGKNLNIDAGMVQIVEPGPWPFSELAAEDPVQGEWVVCLGHSGGYESGREPPVRTGRYLRRRGSQLVSDAVLIGGDSGGPLFDVDGKVIAINSSIGDNVAENRHVFISEFRQHWDRLKRGDQWGQLPELAELDEASQKPKIGVTVDRQRDNAIILRVKEDSPASRAGIQVNDVVVEFNGTAVYSAEQLIELIGQRERGDVVPIAVQRNGAVIRMMIDLETGN